MSWHDDLIDAVRENGRKLDSLLILLDRLVGDLEDESKLCRCGHLSILHDETGKGDCLATAVGGICPCRTFHPANP